MTKRDTRAELIAAGMSLLATQGYNATGIEAVLKQAGVPKGSFYHYFGSKEEFGLAVIDHFAERFSQRLDAFLARVSGLSRARVQRLMEGGLVLVDGSPEKPRHRITPGQRIEVRIPDPTPLTLTPERIPLDILHEDADLIVLGTHGRKGAKRALMLQVSAPFHSALMQPAAEITVVQTVDAAA